MRSELPSGTVTFLFTDIAGSTKLLDELGAEVYAEALVEHRRVLREAFARHGGVEVGTQGDSFFIAFPTASGALEAAEEAQEALGPGPIRVRMALHTGTPHLVERDYVGQDVHKAARIAAVGHGGQVLISDETRQQAQVDLTDLGEHHLKDFAETIRIFQLGSARFPPLNTISNTNLPRPASLFVGREKEVSEVVLLLRDTTRLLTLTGPGGSGKTRLAIEAAAELVPEFKAGVFWVGLAQLRDPVLVTDAIAQTLGAKKGLVDHVGQRELLLLLDNLEQVIEAGPELASLVEACPNLRLLVTSRELLRVRGEVEYPVLPLAEPEAVELFCARAGVEPDETVHELCRALDNLPLALELAAARAKVLSPKQTLERISECLDLLKGGRDADPRQQTLRATIEWSYQLLSEEERRILARLAVFSGGFTLEAAVEITEADLDTLQSLVEKSLIRHREDRFWMLETIREYSTERLEDSGEAEDLLRRHSEHFLTLAEEAEPNLRESPGKWVDRLAREHDNLRAALDRLHASGESELLLRLAGALWRFWYLRGHLAEGGRRLGTALRLDQSPSAARAKALIGAAGMAVEGGDAATAKVRAEEALALHRKLGDAWGTANSAFMMGQAALTEGDMQGAQQLFEESVRRFSGLGDEHLTLLSTLNLARTYAGLGDHERARALHDENLHRARALRNDRVEAMTLGPLAMYAFEEGLVEDALSMLKESLRILHDFGEIRLIPWNLCRFAAVVASERPETATRLLASSESLFAEIGARPAWAAAMTEETMRIIRTQLVEAALAVEWERGQALTVDEAVALALDTFN